MKGMFSRLGSEKVGYKHQNVGSYILKLDFTFKNRMSFYPIYGTISEKTDTIFLVQIQVKRKIINNTETEDLFGI